MAHISAAVQNDLDHLALLLLGQPDLKHSITSVNVVLHDKASDQYHIIRILAHLAVHQSHEYSSPDICIHPLLSR